MDEDPRCRPGPERALGIRRALGAMAGAARRLMRREVAGHRLPVWLLWAAGALALTALAMSLGDPALCWYAFDPELLAVMVVVGMQGLRADLRVLGPRLRGALRRCTPRRILRQDLG